MYPHERSLVKKLADKPFALLGINSDVDKAELKKVLQKEEITWRSWSNGAEGPGGPIAKAWNVSGWPTIYVLDHKGVIRFKGLPDRDLDAAIEELLKELEDGKK